MLLSRSSSAAFAVLAVAMPVDGASFANVQISQFQQTGLDLSFLVSWDSAASPSTDSHLIDIWLETRQPDPSTFVETVLHKDIENTGSMWIDAGDSWAARSSWDNTISGEATVCVYNSSDLFDNVCSEGLGILPEAEAPSANPGDGISDVDVPRVDQNGSSLKFSVTWADGGGDGGFEDTSPLVDIWLAAQQSDPPAWVEVAVQLNAENERLAHLEVDMDWSTSGWDATRDGQLQSCVYDSQDYANFACSDFTPFVSSQAEDGVNTEEDINDNNNNSSSNDRGEGGERGTVIALVVAGGLIVGLVGWMTVLSARRRQRRRWLGTANEAEALPEDVFIRPVETYSGFH